jgi:hypothetical protein
MAAEVVGIVVIAPGSKPVRGKGENGMTVLSSI